MELIDVDRLMAGELGQWLKGKAGMRKQAKATAWRRLAFGVPIGAVLIALAWYLKGDADGDLETGLAIGLSIAVPVVVLIAVTVPIANAMKDLKTGINSAIAEHLGLEYTVEVAPGSSGRGAGWEPAKRYGLLPSYNKSRFEDCWSGEVAGHEFRAFEATLHQETGSGKDRSSTLKFRGCIVQMALGRELAATVLVRRKGALGSLFGSRDGFRVAGEHLDLVEQVHPDFRDRFEVYSTDQVEARTLVHPAYVEQLLDIERAFGAQNVRALFHDGLVVIALESGNLFESGSLNPEKDRENVERTAGQFASLARLALAFNQTGRGQAMGAAGPRAIL